MKASNQCEKIIIGSAQFGLNYGITNTKGKIKVKEAQKILETSLQNNIRIFDTAKSYGNSEIELGKFSSSNVKFITKISGHDYIAQIEDSLQKLNTDNLYCVLMHDEKEAYLSNKQKELITLKNKNLTHKIGISIYDYVILEKLLNTDFLSDIDVIQVPLNIFSMTKSKIDILERIKENDIEIHVRSIFLQGVLLLDNYNNLPSFFDKHIQTLIEWDNFIKNNNFKKLDVCLSSVLNLSFVDKVVLGVESSEQLTDLINYKHIFNLPEFNINDVSESLTNPTKWSL